MSENNGTGTSPFEATFRVWRDEKGELRSTWTYNRPPASLEATVWHLMMKARCLEIETMYLEMEKAAQPQPVTPPESVPPLLVVPSGAPE